MLCQIFFYWILVLSSLWILWNPTWIRGLLPETKNIVYVPSREHHVCFFQASVAIVGIKSLTYPDLMANWQDGDHHNNDSGDNVNNLVLTKAEFLDFCDENQQFCDSTK